jgi:metallo-beta-lactamase class B
MKNLSTFFFLVVLNVCLSQTPEKKNEFVIAEGLSVIKLTDHIYQHVSDLQTTDFGKVKCNGLIYINGRDAIICDTPTNDELSTHLIEWLKKTYPSVKIKAVIINHFHADCLGGLQAFHKARIPSYSHELTKALLVSKGDTTNMPQNFFSAGLQIKVGGKTIINYYLGEAHTRDNIITWIPSESTIFGGCMVKSMNAGKGNLADANVEAWPHTIEKIKSTCPTAKIVVPGHGDAGGKELLDYTIALFQ